jgi:hypothetical protein
MFLLFTFFLQLTGGFATHAIELGERLRAGSFRSHVFQMRQGIG